MAKKKPIEKATEPQDSGFSLKKQILYIVIFLALIGVTFYAIVGQNEELTFRSFMDYVLSLQPFWLLAGILCVFMFIMLEGMSIRYIAGKLGYKRGYYNGFIYSTADIYFSAITPSASGGQPASAFYMVKDKIPMSVTTITLVLNIMQYTMSLAVISLLCFVLRPEYFHLFDGWSQLLIIIGVIVQIVLTVLFAMLVFFPNIIKGVCEWFITLLTRMKIMRKRRRKLKKLYNMVDEYRDCAKIIKESPVIIAVAFLFNLLQRFFVIAVTYCVYKGGGNTGHSFIDVMAVQGYVLIGSNSIPVPGAVGIADYLFLDGFKTIFSSPASTTMGEIVSRGLSFYICIIVCGGFTLGHHARLIFKGKKNK